MGTGEGVFVGQRPRWVGKPRGAGAFAIIQERIVHTGWGGGVHLFAEAVEVGGGQHHDLVVEGGLWRDGDVDVLCRG